MTEDNAKRLDDGADELLSDLLLDWPYAEQRVSATLDQKLIEGNGHAHMCRALNMGRAIAVIGSGVSNAYGRPLWSSVLDHMRHWVQAEASKWENIQDKHSGPAIDAFVGALTAFEQHNLDKPLRPGTVNYTAIFQVIENLYVATRKLEYGQEGDPHFAKRSAQDVESDAYRGFRNRFRRYFRGHDMRVLGFYERVAPLICAADNGNDAIVNYRKKVLDNYRKKIRRSPAESKKQVKQRRIRDLLFPPWIKEDQLVADVDTAERVVETAEAAHFVFSDELFHILCRKLKPRFKKDSKVEKEINKYISRVFKEITVNKKEHEHLFNQPGLWFLTEMVIGLYAVPHMRKAKKVRKTIFRLLLKEATSRQKKLAQSASLENRRTIPMRDPLTRVFRDLGVTRFMTTNYDLEIEAMFEYHGYCRQSPASGNSDVAELAEDTRETYVNVTGERSTSLNFTLRNAPQMIDFSLDERADLSYVVHLHGNAEAQSALAVTEADYKVFHVSNELGRDTARSAMDLAFTSNPLVFIGLGMEEPDILRPLRAFSDGVDSPSDRPAIAILPRRNAGASSIADILDVEVKHTKGEPQRSDRWATFKQQVDSAAQRNSARLLLEWGIYSVFYGEVERADPDGDGAGLDRYGFAEIFFHLSRVTRNPALIDMAVVYRNRDKKKKPIKKRLETLHDQYQAYKEKKDSSSYIFLPLRSLHYLCRKPEKKAPCADFVSGLSKVEGIDIDAIKLDVERALLTWPEKKIFKALEKLGKKNFKDDDEMLRLGAAFTAYFDLAVGLEQILQTAFLTARLSRLSSGRHDWMNEWARLPDPRDTVVSNVLHWDEDVARQADVKTGETDERE